MSAIITFARIKFYVINVKHVCTMGLQVGWLSMSLARRRVLFTCCSWKRGSPFRIAQRRDTGLVNAQHGALFGTDFINNRGHVGRWTGARTRLER